MYTSWYGCEWDVVGVVGWPALGLSIGVAFEG